MAYEKNAKGKDVAVGKQKYSGDSIEPSIRVMIKQGKTWVDVDPANYSVTYINNVQKGKAVILVNGNGTETAGSKTAKFSIVY
ncbi:MAG: hypothetical protein K6E33_08815 [Lachnospiraceae bacterium]|nr:hypothetical protein [Lachnospiraceae bacterium]